MPNFRTVSLEAPTISYANAPASRSEAAYPMCGATPTESAERPRESSRDFVSLHTRVESVA